MKAGASDQVSVEITPASLQQQLFRYAQDLQDLVGQQLELQERYRTVLGFLGHRVPDDDALASAFFKGPACHLTTDMQGKLLSVDHAPSHHGPWRNWKDSPVPIAQQEPQSAAGVFQSILDKFATSSEVGGLEYREVVLGSPTTPDGTQPYDLLALQTRTQGLAMVHWLLQPTSARAGKWAQVLGGFVRHIPTACGVIAADPDGAIVDTNDAMAHITGYTREELRGQSPRTYGSGHHPTAFFHDFWMGLLDKGRWEGHILNRRKNGTVFLTWESVRMVEDARGRVVGYMAATLDMSPHTEARGLHDDPLHDPISGVTTRSHFETLFDQSLTAAQRDNQSLALLFLDIDGIKQLGESFGFGSGDQLRRQLGRRLMTLERPGLQVAQLGTEDFLLLLEGDPSEGEITATANAALAVTTSAFRMGRHNVYLRACVGCARFPRDGRDMQTLIERADAAMYGAKQFNRRFSFFESETQGG